MSDVWDTDVYMCIRGVRHKEQETWAHRSGLDGHVALLAAAAADADAEMQRLATNDQWTAMGRANRDLLTDRA